VKFIKLQNVSAKKRNVLTRR